MVLRGHWAICWGLHKGLCPLTPAKDRRASSRSERAKGGSGVWELAPAWLACFQFVPSPLDGLWGHGRGCWGRSLGLLPLPPALRHCKAGLSRGRRWTLDVFIPGKQRSLCVFRQRCVLIITMDMANRVDQPLSQSGAADREEPSPHCHSPGLLQVMVWLSATMDGFLCCGPQAYLNEMWGLWRLFLVFIFILNMGLYPGLLA